MGNIPVRNLEDMVILRHWGNCTLSLWNNGSNYYAVIEGGGPLLLRRDIQLVWSSRRPDLGWNLTWRTSVWQKLLFFSCSYEIWDFLLPAYGRCGDNPIYPHSHLVTPLLPQHLERKSPAFREWEVVPQFQPNLLMWRIAAAIQVVVLALLWEERDVEAKDGLVQCNSAQNYL